MNKKGFTLVELLAVMVIVGVLFLIALPAYNKYIENARETKCNADKKAIEDAAMTFVNDCISNSTSDTEVCPSIRSDEGVNIGVSKLTTDDKYLKSKDFSKYNDLSVKIQYEQGAFNYTASITSDNDFNDKCK